MPNNEEHSKSTYQKLGVWASDVHRWMDEPWKSYGRSHREIRHDPDAPPEWAVEKYGLALTQKIMSDHVELDVRDIEDKFGNPNEYSILEDNEKVDYVLKTGNTDFIVTDNQFIITQDNNVIGRYLFTDILGVEFEIRKNPESISLMSIILGMGVTFFISSIWPIGAMIILFGVLSLIYKKKILKINSSYSPTDKLYIINADELEINQLIMVLKQRKNV